MHTLIVVLLAGAAACAAPRPLGPTTVPALSQLPHPIGRQPPPFLRDYMIPRMLMPSPLFRYEDSPRAIAPADSIENDWLNKEIDRINQMEEDAALAPLEVEFSRWVAREPYASRSFGPFDARALDYAAEIRTPSTEEMRPLPPPMTIDPPEPIPEPQALVVYHDKTSTPISSIISNEDEKKKTFALTPLDKEYYEPEHKKDAQRFNKPNTVGELELYKVDNTMIFQPPRPIRQNPNLGRTKNLVAENLDVLRTGFTQENPVGTDKPRHIHVMENTADPADSIYGIALIAAVGAAITMAIFGFAFGWYTLSKKAKAAADVDYPAYGVTGPTIDTSGDRKLAHSAHMYHYQHQKQQIIAMERNGLDHRNGSVSDPESEEENEEGDYTVYECPGFATTGEMEVKNPLFSEDPTPATPGKCEIVKPQPKD